MNKINEFLGQFGAECLETLAMVSYDWLVVIGLVMYIFGWDKGEKCGMMCPSIYVIIQILAKVICHV